ncbi:CAP domain-containing protein [Streptomyces sp. H10-C2]|uniref:CAP domain-containing protein n=1 Tax=unclassified Streptomyces TaxID=2593676 RepID=UPI0024BB1A41|nr:MULTISPECIES: CAP domain-containing protein [unclassified Streptomyces]MDJ0343608.1 CAP domain-containing protein [Streptomyces sp. PH10-H1]MDJ0373144.1 CAP domain-containing protein [Streptomyces sp. H10-C2]
MSSHRRAGSPGDSAPQHRAPRRPRLRKAVIGAAVIAALGGGTAFACIGGGATHTSSQPTTDTPTAGSGAPPTSPATPPRTPETRPTHPTATPSRIPPRHTPTTRPVPTPTKPVPSTTPSRPPASGDAAQQVLALINKARADQGLPAYLLSAGLNRSAAGHNQVMLSGCGLSHQCPGEPAFGDRERAQGVQWSSAGENIGEGGPVSATEQAMATMAVNLTQGMLDERPPNDGHRRNILSSSFTHIGIAVTRDGSGTVWLTQDFSQ